MSVLELLSSSNFIAVNRAIASEVGLEAAVILGELASEYIYHRSNGNLKDGYFFSTIENLSEKTFLSAHSQRMALSKLQEKGWIDVTRKGIPAKRYIKINEQQVIEFFNNKSLKFLTTGDSNFEQQEVKNLNGNKNITNNNIEKEYSDIYKEKPKKTRFVPPTIEEVRTYCQERNNNIDPEAFIDYYSSQKWKKANGRPVENWQACIRTWEKRNKDKPKSSGNEFIDLLNQWEVEENE